MDWNSLISDLEGAGLTQKEVAKKAGCSQPYISQLKGGRRKGPDFIIGQALVDMHKKARPDLYARGKRSAQKASSRPHQ